MITAQPFNGHMIQIFLLRYSLTATVCVLVLEFHILLGMALYDQESPLVSENDHGVAKYAEMYHDSDLSYIKDIPGGGMSRISLFYLERDGYRLKVIVKRLLQRMLPNR